MRWTIRGIQTGMADAVRELAYESDCTLGEVVMLCIQHGLSEARRHLDVREIATRRQEVQPRTHDVISEALRRYVNRPAPAGADPDEDGE
jgi:hypothetical protein